MYYKNASKSLKWNFKRTSLCEKCLVSFNITAFPGRHLSKGGKQVYLRSR